jgi:tetratricopeptide (TPR) repeat protein
MPEDVKIEDLKVSSEPLDRSPEITETFSADRFEKFIMGEITLGQLYGITIEEAYSVAELGYTLYEQGRWKDAQTVFQGLVISDPYDGYFHTMLGAVYQKQNLVDGAIEEYSIAIGLDPANIDAYVNRGELLMQKGSFEQAAKDFKQAIELDPDGTNRSANRARALASAIAAALQASLTGSKNN